MEIQVVFLGTTQYVSKVSSRFEFLHRMVIVARGHLAKKGVEYGEILEF
jgi:hypothetical protein